MDETRFDGLTRSLARSRRSLLGAASALAVGPLTLLSAEAKRKRKKKKRKAKKPQPNEFGCLEVGDACTSEAQCCSGICEGKKGKQTCRAHGTGTCPQDQVGICVAPADVVPLLKCNNGDACFCYTTTAGSSFCGELGPMSDSDDRGCSDCQTDADCLALGYPAGSACAPANRGYCAGVCETGMACLAPCGVEFPAPAP